MTQCLTMTSLKTKNICFLAAFLFLAIDPTLAEVVGTVQNCNQFLYQGIPPEIPNVLVRGNIQNQNRYKVICQTYGNNPNPNNNRRFLTVYDTRNKIPVFSAYEYTRSAGPRPDPTWMIEPQLENIQEVNMRTQGHTTCNNQAMNADYDGNGRGYVKGHLFPVNHATTNDDKISTFTLTNAVPQVSGFNGGRWRVMETNIKNVMDQNINNNVRCFVVVGAIPSGNNIPNNNLNNRVNIPSRMWSAFRCTNGVSGAYWDDNVVLNRPRPMVRITLQQLELDLGIDAFP
ncbi:Endonuclease domain-containing 1 protein [Collichthys lucidus]|uniref:Endonuclease domain-containing 1 protein n=1 Tax=Collichthys lucidus TaxID=240159 RepID=A0A4U5VWQ7_COLLU|nr:Endonuclease domain-containing 1 protein [Collichthys lucidus]